MSAYTPAQAAQILYQVGFRASGLVTGLQIIMQESNLDPTASTPDGLGGTARGWWQFTTDAWPQISDSCAYDPVCSSTKAFAASNGGTSWGPWSADLDGRLDKWLASAQAAAASVGQSGTGAVAASAASSSTPATRPWLGYAVLAVVGAVALALAL